MFMKGNCVQYPVRKVLAFSLLFMSAAVLYGATTAKAEETCIMHETLIRQIDSEALQDPEQKPEYRVTRADDGQSLIYWHYGGEKGRFFAVTFMSNGCAIMTDNGTPRKFTFPKTAYNTGVFFEMDIYKSKF